VVIDPYQAVDAVSRGCGAGRWRPRFKAPAAVATEFLSPVPPASHPCHLQGIQFLLSL